jgi:hypothetical protein
MHKIQVKSVPPLSPEGASWTDSNSARAAVDQVITAFCFHIRSTTSSFATFFRNLCYVFVTAAAPRQSPLMPTSRHRFERATNVVAIGRTQRIAFTKVSNSIHSKARPVL